MILLFLRNGGTITVVAAKHVEVRENVLYCLDDRSRIVASLQAEDVETYSASSELIDEQLDRSQHWHGSN